jgi:protoporphyrinogen/coproporphyrinogen III oxidase
MLNDEVNSEFSSSLSIHPSALVIGGGIAGLAAAYQLATRRVPFVLLESSDRLGGLIATEHVGGCTIDSGADSMLAQKRAGMDLCDELGLGARVMSSTPPRTAYVYARGSLHALPSPSIFGIPRSWSALAGYELLPWPARIRLALGLLSARESGARRSGSGTREAAEDESVGSFFRRRFGPATVDLIAQPLLGGIHAGDVERLSIASVAPRLLDADFTARAPADTAAPSDGLFRALIDGMGELVSAIEQRLPADSVQRENAVTGLSRSDRTWQVMCRRGLHTANAVILAAPAHVAARLSAAIDPELSALCAEIPYVSTASVAMAWPRDHVHHPLRGSGFVVARGQSDLRITACTWVSSKWAHRAPDNVALLRAFVGGALDPEVEHLSDADLIAIAQRDLRRVLGIQGEPTLVRVQRWHRAGAQHEIGHQARLARIDARLAQLPGLFVAGSGFRVIGVPDCIADGRAAGQAAARYVKIQT